MTAFALLLTSATASLRADDEISATSDGGFVRIIEEQTRQTFTKVAEYVTANPNASDAEAAYRWLFQTARALSNEAESIPLAEAYLARTEEKRFSRTLAEHVRSIGLARKGNLTDAVAGFVEHLKSAQLKSPGATVNFALDLSAMAQLAGDYAADRELHERLSGALFLNPAVREICEIRLAKLDLMQHSAPEISVQDLNGSQINITEYAGKVVIVDFWGTDCLPCLEEFPSLKQLYADYHEQGLEIIGISLDEDPALVERFNQQAELPWRLALSLTDHDATRRRYAAAKIPSVYLINQKGDVICYDIHGRDLRQAVERLIGKESTTLQGATSP